MLILSLPARRPRTRCRLQGNRAGRSGQTVVPELAHDEILNTLADLPGVMTPVAVIREVTDLR